MQKLEKSLIEKFGNPNIISKKRRNVITYFWSKDSNVNKDSDDKMIRDIVRHTDHISSFFGSVNHYKNAMYDMVESGSFLMYSVFISDNKEFVTQYIATLENGQKLQSSINSINNISLQKIKDIKTKNRNKADSKKLDL